LANPDISHIFGSAKFISLQIWQGSVDPADSPYLELLLVVVMYMCRTLVV